MIERAGPEQSSKQGSMQDSKQKQEEQHNQLKIDYFGDWLEQCC